MRQTTLAVVLVLLAAAVPAQAQFAPKFGFIGGANLTHVDLTDPARPPSDIYHGQTVPGAGAVMLFPVADRLAVRMDLMWLSKGQTVSGKEFNSDAGSLDLTFFEVPVLAVVDILGGRFRPYVIAGPSFGLLLNASVYDPTLAGSSDVNYAFDTLELSLIAGGGFAYQARRVRFFIETRYARGLNNIEAEKFTVPGGSTPFVNTETMKTRGVQIMVGVTAR